MSSLDCNSRNDVGPAGSMAQSIEKVIALFNSVVNLLHLFSMSVSVAPTKSLLSMLGS